MNILPAGRCLFLDDLSTSSSSPLICCSAISIPSKATPRAMTSCSWCPAAPFSGSWNPVFVFTPIPAPGLVKQLASSLASREAWVWAAERSCCSTTSRCSELPTEFPEAVAELRSPSRRRSRASLRRLSSCMAILLPALSTATPQEPPYWATNLTKRTNVKDMKLWF